MVTSLSAKEQCHGATVRRRIQIWTLVNLPSVDNQNKCYSKFASVPLADKEFGSVTWRQLDLPWDLLMTDKPCRKIQIKFLHLQVHLLIPSERKFIVRITAKKSKGIRRSIEVEEFFIAGTISETRSSRRIEMKIGLRPEWHIVIKILR